MALEETSQLKTASKVSKVHIQLLGDLVSSIVRVFFARKSWMVMSKLRFLVLSQNVEQGATNSMAPKETTQLKTVSKVAKVYIQLLGGLVSSNGRVFFNTKVEQWCPRLRFLVPYQNVENGASIAVAPTKTSKLRTMSKVSKLYIQLLCGLVSSNVRVFFVRNVEWWCHNFAF